MALLSSQAMAAADKTRVVIVDDHPLFRQGLSQVVVSDPRFQLIAEADNGRSALDLILKQKPDVAVLDINLPQLSGLEIARALQTEKSKVRVIILTMHKEEATFNQAMNLGVRGYVLKDNAVTDIINCLVSVARGEPYLSPSISAYLLRRHSRSETLASQKPGLESLTTAERRILRLIAQNKTSKEIGAELFISPRTVESHRANISDKLELKGANRLLQFALENRDALNQLN